ncbi:hypothetical protein QLX08_005910 [Tetragonisca angustula]|uniref:Copia protein n=1 Tax=Tetragonisca angustula TaxID=166442 RepID=A0AAW0ZVZ1_9HYME
MRTPIGKKGQIENLIVDTYSNSEVTVSAGHAGNKPVLPFLDRGGLYISLNEACQETLWLRKLLQNFQENIKGPIKIYEDNQGCLKLVKDQKFSKRSKYIDIRYHFIRDFKESNIIDLIYCNTNNIIADIMKPICSTRLIELSKKCGLKSEEL